MRFSSASDIPIRVVPRVIGNEDGHLSVTLRVLTLGALGRIGVEVAGLGLPSAEHDAEVRRRVLSESLVAIDGLEIDGVPIAAPAALIALLDRLPAAAAPLLGAIEQAAIGGAPLDARPSAPSSP